MERSLFKEFQASVTERLLRRQRWNVESWYSLQECFSQLEEVIVASVTIELALRIISFHFVENGAVLLIRVSHENRVVLLRVALADVSHSFVEFEGVVGVYVVLRGVHEILVDSESRVSLQTIVVINISCALAQLVCWLVFLDAVEDNFGGIDD